MADVAHWTAIIATTAQWIHVCRQRQSDKIGLIEKTEVTKPSSEKVIKDIRRITRKQYGAEEKIRIVLDGLRGEESIAALCRREGIAESLYYNWSKEFLEAGKKRLAGDTARAATTDEVKVLRRETRDLKEVVAEQALELRLLKKSMIADGGDHE
jgi:transposase